MSAIVNYLIYVLVVLCTSGFLQDGQSIFVRSLSLFAWVLLLFSVGRNG